MGAYQRLNIWDSGDVTVARFRDRHLDDLLQIEQVGKEFGQLMEEGKQHRLVLDFADVEYVSSSLLGKLIGLNAKVQACNGRLTLCGIRPEVLAIFHTCKLDLILSISKDVADALPRY
jgi:anti-anti-sigma factor